MGKRTLSQRKGGGGPSFKAPSWRRVGEVRYRPISDVEKDSYVNGKVLALIHDRGRGAPVALVKLDDGGEQLILAPEGLTVGSTISCGLKAPPSIGNILPLRSIPEGTSICNIELTPNDGGRLARTSGAYATVVAQTPDKTIIKLPSGLLKPLSSDCRATIGMVAGGGRIEKPFLKAGARYHHSKSRSYKWPEVRGKAMGAYAHKFGGGSHPKAGTPVSHSAPPGRKVGHISPKKTGRGRRK